IVVEVDPRDVGEGVQLASEEGRAARATQSLTDAFRRIGPAVDVVLGNLRGAARSPDEIELEFGLKVGGEAGLIFAKGSAETAFKVRLTWKRPDDVPTVAASSEVGGGGR